MSDQRDAHRGLRDLLARVAEGRVDDAGCRRLNALLADDASARAVYIDYVATDTMLRWLRNTDAPQAVAVETARMAAPVVRRESPGIVRRVVPLAAAAALLVAAAVVVVVANGWRDGPPVADLAEPVAVLADAGDLVLVESTGEPALVGGALRPGWIQVPAGVAEISFKSGAVVRLEGPARLRLETPSAAEFEYGRLAAHVPDGARGFTVRLGQWKVVDLGTAFGIEARPDGSASVQVFEGVVRIDSADGSTAGRRLSARQAVSVSGGSVAEAAYNRGDFGGLLMDLLDAETPEPPVADGLAMWLSAERGVEREQDAAIKRWRSSVESAAPQASQSMAERRPQWVTADSDGRPVVRFDGGDALVLPSAAALGLVESDYEMFFVARTDDPGVQFLIAGSYGVGTEQFELHLNGGPGLRFIPRHHMERPDGTPADQSYGDQGAHAQYIGATHVFEARVVDGVGVTAVDGTDGTDTVPDARSLYRGELTLGTRGNATYGFRGDLYEVLIYNRALSDAERSAVRAYLMTRHEAAAPTVRDGGASVEQGRQNNENEEGVRP